MTSSSTPPGDYVGNVDLVSEKEVTGWIWKPAAPDQRIEVELVFLDGRKLSGLANVFRPDVGTAGIGDGNYGFHFPIGAGDRGNILSVQTTDGRFVLRNLVTNPAPATLSGDTAPPPRALPIGRKRPLTGAATEGLVAGVIEQIQGSWILGWMFLPCNGAVPVLTVDGVPLECLEWLIDREDVREAIGTTSAYGFRFRTTGFAPGARLRLFMQVGERLIPVTETVADVCYLERNTLRQLYRALAVARQPGAVAVTCWDGAHNPIGRAKVLYDIVATRRPVALFSYLMGDFGRDIWPPLSNSDAVIVTIPWAERERYHRVIAALDIRFDLVWLCKARLPTFELAAAVARPDARLILDFDDNEDHFSRSQQSQQKVYGASMIGLCRLLTDRIPARTAASATLQARYGARLVRHARAPEPSPVPRKSPAKGPFNIGFIGTVRPHKCILEAANAIRLMAWRSGLDLRFHVYGDISPSRLQSDLQKAGVTVKDTVLLGELRAELAAMDVILTGFPSADDADSAVTEYQISSKIGDALAMGRPVLTPRSPSVSDLDGVPGVFLFDETDFVAQMGRALQLRRDIALPGPFTLKGAYEGLAEAERLAEQGPRARDAFALTAFASLIAPVIAPAVLAVAGDPATAPALLLIWKQNDGGLYGRRVDQIARAYRRSHPGHRVIVLEFQNDARFANQAEAASQAMSEARHIVRLSRAKATTGHTDADGIAYHEIRWQEIVDRDRQFDHFLISQSLYPDRTVAVLFPIMNDMGGLHAALAPYATISDVVDNHISWESGRTRSEAFALYHTQTMNARHVVFNSAANAAFFRKTAMIGPQTKTSVIPNWYLLPANAPVGRGTVPGQFNILYSGNMNNRIDWSLMEVIADLSDRVRLHLIGAAQRAGPGFDRMLDRTHVIYHGALTETDTLSLLRMADLAVMPHLTDGISTFMNPLKLHMYQAMGVPTVALDVPGIAPAPLLTICPGSDSFRGAVAEALAAAPQQAQVRNGAENPPEHPTDGATARAYVTLIDTVRAGAGPAQSGSAQSGPARSGR